MVVEYILEDFQQGIVHGFWFKDSSLQIRDCWASLEPFLRLEVQKTPQRQFDLNARQGDWHGG
jgi:hypothetical protein